MSKRLLKAKQHLSTELHIDSLSVIRSFVSATSSIPLTHTCSARRSTLHRSIIGKWISKKKLGSISLVTFKKFQFVTFLFQTEDFRMNVGLIDL